MKNMGVNAVRNSHNVAAPELLELCDEMGLLVLNEAFDKWNATAGMSPDTDFYEFMERNMTNFLLRDRNHPSIILWSIGNEIRDIQANAPGSEDKIKAMAGYVNKFDPDRPVTMVKDDMNSVKYKQYKYLDVHAWNYGRRYMPARIAEPNKPVIISESASTISTRGFYDVNLPEEKTDYYNPSLQISSYDLNAPWWAEPADYDFYWQEIDTFVVGQFVWTGFDYLGEPTPYNIESLDKFGLSIEQTARSSFFGIVDLCGIPKDRYYLYKSLWKPEEMTVHILPHWNWSGMEGKNIPVFVYTNGNEAELFLNGKSLGRRKKIPDSENVFERYRLMWPDVKYEPGELKAVAYKKGEVIGEAVVRTASEPYKLKLTPERESVKAGGEELAYILVEALDKEGNLCPLAGNPVTFSVEGNAKIEAVGNGDQHSLEPFQADSRKLFYGKAMLILRSGNETGECIVKAASNGLESTITKIKID
jgi:beta-galactosidase